MAQRIVQQMNALKRTDSLRRELIANVSHDLRTPLTGLQGYLETLLIKESSLSPKDRRNFVEIAIKHSQTLTKLVAELFDLAKLDSGETPLHSEPFSLGELAQDVMVKSQLLAEQAGVRLEKHFLENLPFVVGDIGLIERVLENLIDNAIRHTPSGGTVTLSLISEGDSVIAKVSDTGTGIPPGNLEHIFDRFYQATPAKKDKAGGAGLGLGHCQANLTSARSDYYSSEPTQHRHDLYIYPPDFSTLNSFHRTFLYL